jgi:4-hydroxy-tetrahydrodipicolinate reductase
VTRLAICGVRGRMGMALVRLIEDDSDLQLVVGLDRQDGGARSGIVAGCPRVVPVGAAATALEDVDVVLDFSTPEGTQALLDASAEALAGRALVVGTTGLAAGIETRLDELSSRAAVLSAANFSVGVNLIAALVRHVAAVLPADRYDIEVVEAHHGRKQDAPSGTALALADAAAEGRGRALADIRRDGRTGRPGPRPEGEIGMHAVRGGGIVGDHAVLFLGGREVVELNHRALDRALFAEGALVAARWMAGRRPGRYDMAEVLGIRVG